MNAANNQYQSYLLRLWKAPAGPVTVWRASLESPSTGRRQGFASLQDLVEFLAETCDDELVVATAPNPLAG